jgi:hypothetical protein
MSAGRTGAGRPPAHALGVYHLTLFGFYRDGYGGRLRGLFRKCQPGLRRAGLAVRPKNSAWLRIADSIDC